jgi:hypothetical protein
MQEQTHSSIAIKIVAFFCLLGGIRIFSSSSGLTWNWIFAGLLITVGLLLILPPPALRYLGRITGYIQIYIRQVFPRGYKPSIKNQEASVSEHAYEQGYQANTASVVQKPSDLSNSYEVPQAQYPQQLPPM